MSWGGVTCTSGTLIACGVANGGNSEKADCFGVSVGALDVKLANGFDGAEAVVDGNASGEVDVGKSFPMFVNGFEKGLGLDAGSAGAVAGVTRGVAGDVLAGLVKEND